MELNRSSHPKPVYFAANWQIDVASKTGSMFPDVHFPLNEDYSISDPNFLFEIRFDILDQCA